MSAITTARPHPASLAVRGPHDEAPSQRDSSERVALWAMFLVALFVLIAIQQHWTPSLALGVSVPAADYEMYDDGGSSLFTQQIVAW